ncbi:MAG: hypothetical protein PHR30_11530 [Gallionellaceae bacterium]|nr:hypothetical protein [Gallionellaceae bacterium]
MILEISAMAGATAATAGLTWRLLCVAKREGVAALFTARASETLLHICLLFSWTLFMREGVGVLLHSAPHETMAGYGALFGGLFAMCLARTKTRSASVAAGGNHG